MHFKNDAVNNPPIREIDNSNTCRSSALSTSIINNDDTCRSDTLHRRRGEKVVPSTPLSNALLTEPNNQSRQPNQSNTSTASLSYDRRPSPKKQFALNANPLYPYFPRRQVPPIQRVESYNTATLTGIADSPSSQRGDMYGRVDVSQIALCTAAASGVSVNAHLRRLINQTLDDSTGQFALGQALLLVDELSNGPPMNAYQVLYAINTRLNSRNYFMLSLSLELLEMCVKNCGLTFASKIDEKLMKSMERILKITSFGRKTLVGQVNKALQKYVIGDEYCATTKDMRVYRIRIKVLALIQMWADAFMLHEDDVPAIYASYRRLRCKGINFPSRDPSQRYFVKNAEDSPAFDTSRLGDQNRLTSQKQTTRTSSSVTTECDYVRKVDKIIFRFKRTPPDAPNYGYLLEKSKRAIIYLTKRLNELQDKLAAMKDDVDSQHLVGIVVSLIEKKEELEMLTTDLQVSKRVQHPADEKLNDLILNRDISESYPTSRVDTIGQQSRNAWNNDEINNRQSSDDPDDTTSAYVSELERLPAPPQISTLGVAKIVDTTSIKTVPPMLLYMDTSAKVNDSHSCDIEPFDVVCNLGVMSSNGVSAPNDRKLDISILDEMWDFNEVDPFKSLRVATSNGEAGDRSFTSNGNVEHSVAEEITSNEIGGFTQSSGSGAGDTTADLDNGKMTGRFEENEFGSHLTEMDETPFADIWKLMK